MKQEILSSYFHVAIPRMRFSLIFVTVQELKLEDPSRWLLAEGSIIYSEDKGKQFKSHGFLFNDKLLLTRKSKRSYLSNSDQKSLKVENILPLDATIQFSDIDGPDTPSKSLLFLSLTIQMV